MSPEQVVDAFCAATNRKDMPAMLALIADHCVYQNMPFPPVHGPEGVRTTLEGFFQLTGWVHIEVLKQVAVGNLVMNERIDTFDPPTGRRFGLPVAGAFEVEDGRIVAWRDYFCMRQFSEGTGLSI